LGSEWGFIGLSLVALGSALALVSLAPRPLKLLGVRVGYAFVDEYCWRFLNALASALAMCFGAALAIVSAVAPSAGAAVVASMYVAFVVATIVVGERVAEKRLIAYPSLGGGGCEPIARYRPSVALVSSLALLSLTLFAATLAYALLLYNEMPSSIAVHFNAWGEPDLFKPKLVAMEQLLSINAALAALSIVTSVVAVRKPEVFYRPWLRPKHWRSLAVLSVALASLASAATSLGIMDVVTYNSLGHHIAGGMIIITALAITAAAIAIATLALEARSSRYR